MNFQTIKKVKVNSLTPLSRKRYNSVALIELWAKIPFFLRMIALLALALTIIAVSAGYWRLRNNKDFVLSPGDPQLSQNITAVVNGYERRVTSGDKLQLLVRADRDTLFDDGRHELDNIFLENYPENSPTPDRVKALKAVYQADAINPENFKINFSGKVDFETRDGFRVQTEQISYDKQNEFAETASLINFSRDNLSGSAVGAKIQVRDKHLELQNQVEINVAPKGNLAKNSLTDFGSSAVKINAARASFDQDLAQFELTENVNIVITPQNSDELPTTIRAQKAVYQKNLQKIDLSGSVEIVTASDNAALSAPTNQPTVNINKSFIPVTIRSDAASYEQEMGKIYLVGNASIEQANDLMTGERINAELNKQKKLQAARTIEKAFLRSSAAERTTVVNSTEMDFKFDPNQQIQGATAAGEVKVKSVGNNGQTVDLSEAQTLVLNFKSVQNTSVLEKMTTGGNTVVNLTNQSSADYSNVNLVAPNSTETLFAVQNDQSILKQMTTGGRTIVVMNAPQSQSQNPKATNKKLIADSLKLLWSTRGKDLERAEAVGNAELYIFPMAAAPETDKESIFAERFDCEFYENGNLAKTFIASGKTKAVFEPTVPAPGRGVRNLLADKMVGNFERLTQAIESLNAIGNAKFNELDRNALANNFVYTTNDEIVRLRGGEPTVWDAQARIKAAEIDWDTRRDISLLRGKVATTYYSQEQTGGAAPFAKTNAPVFLVSDQAQFNHQSGVAVYTGNARAWQDNNFVRADKLILQREAKSMFGEGSVQSALYNAKQRGNGGETVVPVFARSDRFSYSDAAKMLRYENNVDIRQGTDQITSGVAEVYLNTLNEVDKTVAQNNVVMIQPNRKAVGEWAQYTSADEVVILRGNPATVQDAAQGASNGRQLTVYLRENRIEGQGGAGSNAPGRVRSTHKIIKQ